ncbi:hypothetical protein FA95DRAFT_1498828 [Auriscalpium vulgare]|uniref:Uncharacterized protein n=1 Tax=Auriscalpium vulgare TaxID=40419 RepID=A0ACB8RGP8_9AGAM|nr:hypothetical protein FA95DRAFT_1498828 [Auriscalpium vulgare]
MAFFCTSCHSSYPTRSYLASHFNRVHRHPKPPHSPSKYRYHPHLTARPCDEHGTFLPPGSPPLPPDEHVDWTPFDDRPSFEFAELMFEKSQSSQGDINQLLKIWAAKAVLHGHDSDFFPDYASLLAAVDSISVGVAPWRSFKVKYAGPTAPESPSWHHEEYVVHTRDIRAVLHNMAGSPDFNGKWESRPYQEYRNGQRHLANLMSGNWAFRQADKVAEDPNTHGAMLVPVILGADKTTVSVATGNTEFHPLYASPGNITNELRRAHRDGVLPIAFLAIPKTSREEEDTAGFRLFKKQLYHESIAQILSPIQQYMTTPDVILCPDRHYRRAIYEIGPFIADYPEQVLLAGIVQDWCPKCLAHPDDLDSMGSPRFREHTQHAKATYDAVTLWDAFGIVKGVTPFTHRFPRADIHELLTPDLLHQVIKGTFKDHLVTWVQELVEQNNTKKDAKRIMDDIDRRIAAVPAFPGLRRFPQGRNFKQWTGDDSKALMKVFIPAIVGHVPDRAVQAIVAFLDFCYLARRSSHNPASLASMERALARFHEYREIFREEGIRPDGFSLPRQHALVHYVRAIKLFGSPYGLCSSITESKHIHAVKKPWRRSSKHRPLAQILQTNERMDKIGAARIDYGSRGMIKGDVLTAAFREMGVILDNIYDADDDELEPDEVMAIDGGGQGDIGDVDEEAQPLTVKLGKYAAGTCSVAYMANTLAIGEPALLTKIRRFLYGQIYPDPDLAPDAVPLDELPTFDGRLFVYHNARATYFAPSELAGPGGMHTEVIRSNPCWFQQYERRDTVLVQHGDDDDIMGGLLVARVVRFMMLTRQDTDYPCALVEWFLPLGNIPDPTTGMWIVRPERVGGRRPIDIIHLDTIVRSCHLIGVYGNAHIPRTLQFSQSHSAFKAFYVNRYADYHIHELLR